jgi:hypothetical protein
VVVKCQRQTAQRAHLESHDDRSVAAAAASALCLSLGVCLIFRRVRKKGFDMSVIKVLKI